MNMKLTKTMYVESFILQTDISIMITLHYFSHELYFIVYSLVPLTVESVLNFKFGELACFAV